MAKYSDEQKTAALTMLEQDKPIVDVVNHLGIPAPTLRRWKKELTEGKTKELLNKAMDCDLEAIDPETIKGDSEVEILENIVETNESESEFTEYDDSMYDELIDDTESIYADVEELDGEFTPLGEDIIAGLSSDELLDTSATLANEVLGKLDNLQLLQENLQLSALAVSRKILRTIDTLRDPKDIVPLVDCISKLQNAFFAKGTNVNVLQMGNASEEGISAFKSLMRDS